MGNWKGPIENPTVADALTFYDSVTGNIIKTIYDASGNLYLWDGEALEHREVMNRYGIPDELYDFANRIYKDFGGEQALIDVINQWQKNIRGKQFRNSAWMD
jgi:hypothetical protein